MSYTKYPGEANEFSSRANGLITNIQDTITGLNGVNGMLSSCNNEDLIVYRSSESITNIAAQISKVETAITSDVGLVKRIANDLENEEKERQLALKKKLEEDGDDNE